VEREDLLSQPLDTLLDRLATPGGGLAGGSAAAGVVAMAAGLVAMAARASHGSWPEAGGAAAQAEALRARAVELAREDAEAFEQAALELDARGDGSRDRDAALAVKLDRAADVPLEIVRTAVDATSLAADAALKGNPDHRADAVAACELAAGAARAAAHLVEVNLKVTGTDPRLAQARELVRAAAADTELARS
jgi:formiminotetrahydrofolate cyclodeaminase